jgi:hypothetical protein
MTGRLSRSHMSCAARDSLSVLMQWLIASP